MTHRHDALRRTLRDMAMSAGVAAEEEPRGLPGFGQGGGDLLLHDYQQGRTAMADVTVVCELKSGVVERAATSQYHAADLADAAKRQRYLDACAQLDLAFMPMAVEVDGALGRGLQGFFTECRRRTGDAISLAGYWAQRLSVCLRRGTARAVRRIVLRNHWDRRAFLQAPDYDALCIIPAS